MPTLRDVAKAARVSLSTASKSLGTGVESTRISEECRRRVQEACRELGYQPNYLARSLAAGRTFSVGSLLRDVPGDDQAPLVWGAISAGMTAAALDHGCQLVIIGARADGCALEAGLQALRQSRVDALVVPALLLTPVGRKRLEGLDLPIVVAGDPHPSRLPTVVADVEPGLRRMLEHLRELGHRRFTWVVPGDDRDIWERQRRKLIPAVAAEVGLDVEELALGMTLRGLPLEEQVELTRASLACRYRGRRAWPTALVGYNEAIALGACAAARERGLHVPRELSIATFDDIHGRAADPPLTEVGLASREVGRQAVELALKAAFEPEARPGLVGRRVRVPTQLVIRKSTAPPRGPSPGASPGRTKR